MQRALLLFSSLFALYACTGTVPHKAEVEKRPSAVVERPVAKATVPEQIAAPEARVERVPAVLPDGTPAPHIALLLPLKSPIFGTAADAVQQGFMAAASQPGSVLPIRVYSDFDENVSVIAAYRQAVANGAHAVVGPLTRNGVGALAAEKRIPVPTLSLNIVDARPTQNLYFFGMAVENEARQAARLAREAGLHKSIVITTHTQLARRLQLAFEEEWDRSGGTISREIEFNNDPAVFADIAEMPDTLIFLATDAPVARLIRPYLPNKLPIYATSQIFVGNDNTLVNYDLDGIHFVDMPWLLQADLPEVMMYPRANPPLPVDHERLYALGIDAFRLIESLLAGNTRSLMLDGVSGTVLLDGHTFQRISLPAVFGQGRAQLPGTSSGSVLPMFPGMMPPPSGPEAIPAEPGATPPQ
ncbi:MAG: penicillin-binding protein activator [Nitrosomonadales bacterium]|nr:penicillin-binding protein activator [Nitrosomonadales bacterium]